MEGAKLLFWIVVLAPGVVTLAIGGFLVARMSKQRTQRRQRVASARATGRRASAVLVATDRRHVDPRSGQTEVILVLRIPPQNGLLGEVTFQAHGRMPAATLAALEAQRELPVVVTQNPALDVLVDLGSLGHPEVGVDGLW